MSKEGDPFLPDYQPRPNDEKCIWALVNFWQNGNEGDIDYARTELEMERLKPEGQRDYWQIYLLTEALRLSGVPLLSARKQEEPEKA